jgi:hypothetical protein
LVFEIEELQYIWVLHEIGGLDDEWRRLTLHLLDHRFPVTTHEQTFEVERVDLALESADAPVLLDGFVHVVSAGFGLLHSHKESVVRPSEFRTGNVSPAFSCCRFL